MGCSIHQWLLFYFKGIGESTAGGTRRVTVVRDNITVKNKAEAKQGIFIIKTDISVLVSNGISVLAINENVGKKLEEVTTSVLQQKQKTTARKRRRSGGRGGGGWRGREEEQRGFKVYALSMCCGDPKETVSAVE